MQKILVVDDEPDMLMLMKTCLTLFGYETQEARSKTEIIPLIFSFKPDLIILDIMLSGENGREICREIKISEHKQIPIILYSAAPALLHDFAECNADAIIEKPFELKQLKILIEDILSSK